MRTALITGGASGIGAALARALARGGADVVLADRQVELAEKSPRIFARAVQGRRRWRWMCATSTP